MTKLIQSAGETAAEFLVFLLAFFLSTGVTCGGTKVANCAFTREAPAEVRAP